METLSQTDRVRSILDDLEGLRENLLALSDDIWLSIDHNDPEDLDRGYEFKQAYNKKLSAFDQVAGELSALVQRFTDIQVEPTDDQQPAEQFREERERIIRELDRSTPHTLDEDFTYKRPFGYTLAATAHKDVLTWKRLFRLVCRQLANRDTERFRSLPQHLDFISNRGNNPFSTDPSSLREPMEIAYGVFVEGHMSANYFRDHVKKLLNYFEIPQDNLRIYLREDRDA